MGKRRALRAVHAVSALALSLLAISCELLPPAPPVDDYIGPRIRPTPLATTQPAPAASQPIVDKSPLALTVQEAVFLALGQNQALRVERLRPSITRTLEEQQRAAFDPIVSAGVSGASERAPLSTDGDARTSTGDYNAFAAIDEFLPSGTRINARLGSDLLTNDPGNDQYVTRLGLTVNQALLRGAGLDVNLVAVRQARLDTLASEYELRAFAQQLVAQTETAYWNYALAQRTIEIVTGAMAVAEEQVRETQERVNAGAIAKTELAAASAELARRKENLINARSAMDAIRLNLLRLMNPTDTAYWQRDVALKSAPAVPAARLDDVDTYVQVALRIRPELNQARLGIQRNELDLVRTRNGLLPRMDLFMTLGKSGYAESFGHSYGNFGGQDYDVLAGMRFEYPPANRAAQAEFQRARYTHQQAMEALENLSQLAQVDVRTAYIEVNRAREQVAATAATRKLQEETLRAETEKFRVGKSTSFLVAQAQRDLLQSQIDEVASVVSYLKALVQLQLQQGTILERRGISAPGERPVNFSEKPRE